MEISTSQTKSMKTQSPSSALKLPILKYRWNLSSSRRLRLNKNLCYCRQNLLSKASATATLGLSIRCSCCECQKYLSGKADSLHSQSSRRLKRDRCPGSSGLRSNITRRDLWSPESIRHWWESSLIPQKSGEQSSRISIFRPQLW